MKKTQYFQAFFKTIPTEGKEIAQAGAGVKISGYASTPTLDRYDDVVEPNAFKESIRKSYRKNPIVLFQHNPERPVGFATHMSIDEKGLYIEAEIHDAEIEGKILSGILRAFSIGYVPKKTEYLDADGNKLDPVKDNIWGRDVKRIIKKVDLVENSIVSVPANPDALFTMQKSAKSFFDKIKNLENEEKSTIIENEENLNPPNMKKKNLLNSKSDDEETEKTEVSETNDEEAETSDESAEAPAGEKDDGSEGDEKDSDGKEDEKTEEEKPEESEETSEETEKEADDKPGDEKEKDDEKVEEGKEESDKDEDAKDPKPEDEKAFKGFSDEEKATLAEIATPDGAVVAIKAIQSLQAKVKDLQETIDKIPGKRALANFESEVKKTKVGVDTSVSDKVEGDKEDGGDKKGFKEALQNAAH